MSLVEASRRAKDAAQAGDLDALADALDARARAIADGAVPTPGIIEDGEITVALLRALQREAGTEYARLKQWGSSLGAPQARAAHVDYRG